MEKYDYYEAVKKDIRSYIEENIIKNMLDDYASIDKLEKTLNEKLWIEDSVTGNASGSYTFNNWKAEEYLCHNWDLLEEAVTKFGCTKAILHEGAEWCDVTIRCYILSSCIADVIEDYEDMFEDSETE